MAPERLAARAALVTGGANGIGEAIARRLAAEGATVCVADIEGETARHVAAELGGGAWAEEVDVADAGSVARLAQSISRRIDRLDILVNNAAIADASAIDTLTMEHYRRILDIDLNAVVEVTLAMLPLIRKSGRGKILNIASIMGLRGSPESLPYSTAKGGVINMTRALACDLAPHGITVNALCPGYINTRMAVLPDGSGHEHTTDWFRDIYLKYGRIPLRRPGQPDELAGPALFFCSDDSSYVTGQVMLVDGGLSATF